MCYLNVVIFSQAGDLFWLCCCVGADVVTDVVRRREDGGTA